MLRGLRTLPVWQRRIIFIAVFGGIIVFLIGCTLFLITQTLFVTRSNAVSLVPEVTVREYAALPNDNAYPPTVAAAPDGMIYTGSYATGAIWQIATDGSVSEVPNSRDRIGSVSGIAIAANGALLVVDAGDSDPRTGGGALWRVTPQGEVTALYEIPDERGYVAPDDVAVDAAGNIYVSDRGRNEVWRFLPDGSGELWWVPPVNVAIEQRGISGLAYDVERDALVITDAEANEIYRVAVAGGATETLYQHGEREFSPGFDGVTVAPDGTIYVAALGQNGVAQVGDNELDYIAGLFRGASDVAYGDGRLYVANFDQASLVIPIRPALPFAIDMIEFVNATATPTS